MGDDGFYLDQEALSVSCVSVTGVLGLGRGYTLDGQKWVSNEKAVECKGCNAAFSFLRRKHHCRVCGNIFCAKCSPKTAFPHVANAVRACASCVVRHSSLRSTASEEAEVLKGGNKGGGGQNDTAEQANFLAPPRSWDSDRIVSDKTEEMSVLLPFLESFHSRGKHVCVLKIERVQNLALWEVYAVKRKHILERENALTENEIQRHEKIWLFHGTDAETCRKIKDQGLNRSFSGKNATLYGKGVYFARDAKYSERYASSDGEHVQRIFACRVLVGRYCVGEKDALVPAVRTGNTLFDSTVDSVLDPRIFVTYHDAQAYPEYLIHFTSVLGSSGAGAGTGARAKLHSSTILRAEAFHQVQSSSGANTASAAQRRSIRSHLKSGLRTSSLKQSLVVIKQGNGHICFPMLGAGFPMKDNGQIDWKPRYFELNRDFLVYYERSVSKRRLSKTSC